MSTQRVPLPGPKRFAARPVPTFATTPVTPTSVQKAATTWSKAFLLEHPSWELERALDLVCKHPDAYSSGYSVASTARRRLTTELARRLEERINALNVNLKRQA